MSNFAEALEGVVALVFGGIILFMLTSELESLPSTSVGNLEIIFFIGGLVLGIGLLTAVVREFLRR